MKQENRDEILGYYIDDFCSVSHEDKDKFRGYYAGFSMIRVMQALGAFGFRGLYEQKPTFTESIVPGVKILMHIISQAERHVEFPELFRTIRAIPDSQMFRKLAERSQNNPAMKAMILAAGKGTRLGKISETKSKVLLDINGKTFSVLQWKTVPLQGLTIFS